MRPSALPSTLLIIALLAAGNSAWGQEGNLGRLFFTPEQRASLDRLRQHSVKQSTDSATGNGLAITVQGVVRRSSGKDTAWVNGAELSESSGQRSSNGRREPTRLGIGDRDVRVGDSINQSTGEQSDLLRGGQIQIKPGNATPR